MLNERDSVTQRRMPLYGFVRCWSSRLILPKFISASVSRSVRFHLFRGRILLGLRQYDKAISDFKCALRLNWRHEQAALWLKKASRAIPRSGETGSLT
jgi:hypothetical protein